MRYFEQLLTSPAIRPVPAEISLNTRDQNAAQLRLQLALSGLAVLLSIAVYITTRTMAHRLASNLSALSAELASVTGSTVDNSNEVAALRAHIAALPLDLLRPPVVGNSSTDHYTNTAILYLYFRSLPGYVDTVDERTAPALCRDRAPPHLRGRRAFMTASIRGRSAIWLGGFFHWRSPRWDPRRSGRPAARGLIQARSPRHRGKSASPVGEPWARL